MIVPFVDLKAQYASIKSEIDAAVERVLTNASFIGGKDVTDFEVAFANFQKSSYCISCGNGSDAIEIALEALGIGAGDEVIVPSYTWMSTASSVSRMGATPIFVDVHPEYYTMDASRIEEKISISTKAIIPVHFYGLPADMHSIRAIADSYGLKIIEDCAQAHGAEINGQRVGTFGDLAIFSFFPSKNLGAFGDGGCIITQSNEHADRCRQIARLGQEGKHNHVSIGRNSRLDTLHAAVLNVKLAHLEEWTESRRENARYYLDLLADSEITLPTEPEGYRHVYHVFMIQVNQRDGLRSELLKLGIQTQLHYPLPLTATPVFFSKEDFPVSNSMSSRMISLPMFAELDKGQMEFVAESILNLIKK
jgi:dTDP-4-amino-4,6-dideoxygalactose transaminase